MEKLLSKISFILPIVKPQNTDANLANFLANFSRTLYGRYSMKEDPRT